jgi:hypothetical protein
MYDHALSGDVQCIIQGGWRFSPKLTTENVWDSFVILSLLRDHQEQNSVLQVSHTGDQKDRFTAKMQERNERIIRFGQKEVTHYCDKCMRVYENSDGTLCAFSQVCCA